MTSLSATSPYRSAPGAHLEYSPEQGAQVERISLAVLPLTIGRGETNDQRLYVHAVSTHHAVFVAHERGCAIRDLGSTNGTFVNGERITERVLVHGDIIHLGPAEFCYRSCGHGAGAASESLVNETTALPRLAPTSLIKGTERIRELIETQAVEIVFQPIVDLRTRAVVAYEALARGCHPQLGRSPAAFLRVAEECGLAVEVSRLLRWLAVVESRKLPAGPRLFLNIHPHELDDAGFFQSLESLPAACGRTRQLVLEIAEAAVTNVTAMRQTRDAFSRLGFEFAYDDFGAGQARLLELTDIPPHYLKLDLHVIAGIEAQRSRQDVVQALVRVVGDLGVQVIAEGVETEPVAAMCARLGCHLGQGYLFGKPERLD